MMNEKYQSVHYDSKITKALKLDNQSFPRLKDGSDQERFSDPQGVEIVELLDDTSKNERRVLGHCTFKRFEIPSPFYYVSWVVRDRRFKTSNEKAENNKTVGDLVIERVNTIIKEKGLPAILYNTLPEGSSARSLYERNGWKEVLAPGDWMGYNLPENMSEEDQAEAINEIVINDPYFKKR